MGERQAYVSSLTVNTLPESVKWKSETPPSQTYAVEPSKTMSAGLPVRVTGYAKILLTCILYRRGTWVGKEEGRERDGGGERERA